MRRQPPAAHARQPPPYPDHHHTRVPEPSVMHDYKHKYGTMSGGSALSRSMKYAETWLYGSMAARPPAQRPSLFMYPEPQGYALVMCACADFLSGTTRSKKSAAVCKKCGGSRKTSWNASPTQVRGFGTVRLSQPKSRPELPRLEELKDPYDMMRKSRLAAVSSTLRAPPDGRSRAKSSSPPGRRRRRSKSPPRHRSPDTRFDRRPNGVDCSEPLARKSILECDVNPYELISQYLKNDPVEREEDEFSDNLSDNALDDDPYTIRRPKDKRVARKAATVGSTNKKGFLDALRTKWDEPARVADPLPGGVSIGGQRIRLFSSNEQIPAVTNEFVTDSEENEEEEIYDMEKHKAWFADRTDSSLAKSKTSQLPRPTNSPKRPPRKIKSTLEPVNRDTPKPSNETGGKNRVNFALDVPTQSSRRSNSLTSSASLEIKSILKKPNSTLSLAETLKSTSSPTTLNNSKQDSASETSSRSVTPTGKTFLPSFKDYKQQQNRKKKQVQFRVSEENGLESKESVTIAESEEDGVSETPDIVVTDPESSEVLRLQFFGDNQEDTKAVNQATAGTAGREESPEEHDGVRNNSIQRSLSDRTSPGAEPGCKFNDTMRLRLRTGRRDSREAFTEGGRKPERRVLSPGRPRPKEPPPPPPPPAGEETGDIRDYQETSGGTPPPPPPPPPRQIFPFTKEEIEKINKKRGKTEIRPRSSSNSPVRHLEIPSDTLFSRRTSLTLPITTAADIREEEEGPMWNRESSIVNNGLSPFEENVPMMEALSSVTEVYEALEQNSKYEDGERINFKAESVKLHVPLAEPADVEKSEEMSQNRTIVTVSSSTQNLSVTSPQTQSNRRTSIMITGKENDSVEQKIRKTSVRIGECTPSVNNSGSNKVTISVGGFDYQNSKNKTAKSNTQIEIKNEFKSNITIGPSNNTKRTLVILDSSSKANSDAATKEIIPKEDVKDIVIDSVAQEEMNKLIRNKIDPVEAARQNIVPHVCGKSQEENREREIPTTVPIKEKEEVEKDEDHINTLNTQSSIESETLDDDVFSPKEDNSDDNSDCYVCAKKLKAKQGDEEIRVGLEFDSDENHYEIIRDPIYEEIGDTPPPLPLSPPPATVDIDNSIPTRSIFEGASKYDILNYLETAKERGIVVESEDDSEVRSPDHSRISSLDLSSRISQLSNASDSSEDSCNLIISPPDSVSITSDKVRKSSVEIERNDSGVGSETSKCSRSRWQHVPATHAHGCEDCDQPVETQVTDSGLMFAPLVCRKCSKRRAERREIITEIVETEEKYGRDLRIILEEFYRPMLVAGLLSPEQLSAIFLNVEELLENNAALAEKLRDATEIAADQGDEDFLTVNIGGIFLDAAPMLHAFESYCTRQGAASLLLANLEKEKELLRIFLRVSQMENSVLRRMNLNSFLMVPVQRVTKYPLLLARLYRVTPAHLKSREALRLAQNKIELHLEHINSLAKDISTTKLWRRISIINGRRSSSETDMVNIKLRKVAVDVLEWNHDEVRFAMEGKLLFTQPTDNNWRRGRTIKLSPINAMLVTLGKPTEDYHPDSEEMLAFPRKNGIRDATLLLLKEKSGRYGLLREPLFLDRCIICSEADVEDYFEVQELATKDTYLFKAEDGDQTKRWFRQLQYHAQGLGAWRRRRNALANIMINGMQLRT